MSYIKDTTKAKKSILYNKDLKNEESMYIIYIDFFFSSPLTGKIGMNDLLSSKRKKQKKKKEKEKDFNAKLQSHLNDGRKR